MLKQQFEINDGMSTEHRTKVANALACLLADTYSLYLKTHNFHWNITGPLFNTLHLMFETQYQELALAVDEIAERIRALGFISPGSYSEFISLSKMKEGKGDLDAIGMVKELALSQEVVITTARGVLVHAEDAHDEVTVDLITQRLQVHEKTTWMLRSITI